MAKPKEETTSASSEIEKEIEKDIQNEQNPKNVTMTQKQFDALMNRINSIEQQKEREALREPQGPQISAAGQITSVIERHPIDPEYYEDPIEELLADFDNDPRLRRFGLRDNFELRYECKPVRYQTAFGTWYTEPKFELTLLQNRYDDDGNILPTKIIRGKATFFVDPPANIMEAEEAGVSMKDLDDKTFDKKMRMYRYKFWLTETLSPRRPQLTSNRVRSEVIGGKAYEIEDSSKPV